MAGEGRVDSTNARMNLVDLAGAGRSVESALGKGAACGFWGEYFFKIELKNH